QGAAHCAAPTAALTVGAAGAAAGAVAGAAGAGAGAGAGTAAGAVMVAGRRRRLKPDDGCAAWAAAGAGALASTFRLALTVTPPACQASSKAPSGLRLRWAASIIFFRPKWP